jgi:hypothetical protein
MNKSYMKLYDKSYMKLYEQKLYEAAACATFLPPAIVILCFQHANIYSDGVKAGI